MVYQMLNMNGVHSCMVVTSSAFQMYCGVWLSLGGSCVLSQGQLRHFDSCFKEKMSVHGHICVMGEKRLDDDEEMIQGDRHDEEGEKAESPESHFFSIGVFFRSWCVW